MNLMRIKKHIFWYLKDWLKSSILNPS